MDTCPKGGLVVSLTMAFRATSCGGETSQCLPILDLKTSLFLQ